MEQTRQEIFRAELYAAHNAILSKLVELCPATFAPRGQSCWPLKIKIHEDIAELLPDATPRDISLFLLCYTRQRRYHRSLKEGAPRLDLFGQPAGEVSAAESAHALKMIARSDAKALAARPGKKASAPAAVEATKPEPAPEPPTKTETPPAAAKPSTRSPMRKTA